MFDTYAEIFGERGTSYHRAMAGSPRAREAEFHAVLEPLGAPKDGLLCDLPSGGGYLAQYLPSALEYIGVDPSHEFIEACPPGLKRIEAPMTDVPLPDASVDYIICLAALHHEPDLRGVFREMRRLVRPGGRVVLADVGEGTRPATFLNGFVDRNNPMGHDGRFIGDNLGEMLEDTHFSVIEDRVMQTPWQFGSRREAGEFCRSLFWMPSLSPDEVADAVEAEIGLVAADRQVHVNWVLRRIVCDAV